MRRWIRDLAARLASRGDARDESARGLSALCADLIVECGRLHRENEQLRSAMMENAVFASRWRERCARAGVEPRGGSRLQ